jgi:anti-sigma regulatory factor (Ser/Thr protein kinase)
VRDYELKIVSSLKSNVDDVVESYNYLEDKYGERGREIQFGVIEAVGNYFQHANDFDPEKRVYIQTWRDDTRFYFSIRGEGAGFDPNKVWLTKEERDTNAGEYKRGRGHALMNYYADLVQYDNDGKSMMMVFELDKLRKAS